MTLSLKKHKDKCSKALEQVKCESKGCNCLDTDTPEDCEMTTVSPTTTTETPGCCRGDSYASNDKCNHKDSRDSCDCVSSCEWFVSGVLAQVAFPEADRNQIGRARRWLHLPALLQPCGGHAESVQFVDKLSRTMRRNLVWLLRSACENAQFLTC